MSPARASILACSLAVLYSPAALSAHAVNVTDLGPPIAASTADWKALGRAAGEPLRGWKLPPLPKAFERDRAPRLVFLSVSAGSTARVFYAQGAGVREAIANAAAQVETKPEGWPWLKVDVVQRARAVAGPADFDASLEGQVSAEGAPLLAEQAAARGGSPVPAAFVFTSSGVFLSDEGPVVMLRGHRVVEGVTAAEAHAAVARAASYLKSALDGDPRSLASSAYSLLEISLSKRDPEAVAAARARLASLLALARPCPRGTGLCLLEKDAIPLGVNAMAALALVRYLEAADEPAWREPLKRLGQWLLDSQLTTGDFALKAGATDGKPRKCFADYYAGAAILALVRLHALDRDPRWLQAAERAIAFLYLRDRRRPATSISHDRWLLTALNELQRLRAKPETLAYGLRVAEAIAVSQNVFPNDPPDWRGGWGRPPRTTPTATRSAGLCEAYRLVRDFGSEPRAGRLRAALERGLTFQLQMQLRPESTMYQSDPKRSLGAFRRAPDSLEIRPDYVQPNVLSLLCWSRYR